MRDMLKKLTTVILPAILLCGCAGSATPSGSTGSTGQAQRANSSVVDANAEKSAKKAAEKFLEAAVSGDREEILKTSNIETVCAMFQQLNNSTEEEYQADVDYEIEPWLELQSYTISAGGENQLETLRLDRKNESDLNEYYIWKLDAAGKYEEADKLRGPNPVLGFYDAIEDAYGFDIEAVSKSGESDSVQLMVVKTGGEWVASPVQWETASLSEQQQTELAQFRADAMNMP